MLADLPTWCKEIPYQIKSIAVKDACVALTNGKMKVKRGLIPFFELHFRSRKVPKQSCFIPQTAIKQTGIYHTISGKGLGFTEPLPEIIKDSRLSLFRGRFYIHIPVAYKSHGAENQGRVVAIDPGVRTFATFFSENSWGKLGAGDFGKIQSLCWHLDALISKHSENKKQSYRKAMNGLRLRISNLIDELHWKVANYFVQNFDIILLPTFETSNMAKKSRRKINSKSVRMMMTFSHYKFKQRLKQKAFESGKIVVDCCEAFTSKTNSWTGKIWKNPGRKFVKINGIKINRDLNGARGIFLRALSDTTWLRNGLAKRANADVAFSYV